MTIPFLHYLIIKGKVITKMEKKLSNFFTNCSRASVYNSKFSVNFCAVE